MNSQLERFARDTLKNGLSQCTGAQQLLFKRMYAKGNLEAPIDTVVDIMPADELDWAMQQVQATIAKAVAGPSERKRTIATDVA